VVVEVVVTRERVVVDTRCSDERLRTRGQPADRLDERARGLDAADADQLLLARVPPLRGDRLAGEVNDRVGARERVAPRAGSLERRLHQLQVARRWVAAGLEALLRALDVAHERDDVVAASAELRDE